MSSSMRLSVLVSLAALCLASSAGAQGVGALAGTITDRMKQPLPGVRVTVADPALRRTGVTDADGRYGVADLPAGSYAVTAELPGFETVRVRDVIVAAGTTTDVSLTLEIGCVQEVQRVDPGFAVSLRDAIAIVRMRIVRSAPGESCRPTGFCVCTDHLVTISDVMKSRERRIGIGTIRFVQEGASLAGDPRAGGARAYAPGEEFVAFLRWDPAVNAFLALNGSLYMFPVRDGRVEFRPTDAPGMFDGMTVEEFSLALRALLAAVR
jgi:hypothetical protein